MLIINTDYSEEAHKKVELGLNKLSKDLQPMFVRFMKTLPMTQARFRWRYFTEEVYPEYLG